MEPSQTPYDLRWRMFGIPVRVHPMFWLISLLMGSDLLKMGLDVLVLWVACMFISILVHELGHVWMGQALGSHGHIVLYGFGGLAIGSNQLALRWQRILVCFAGPVAGFLFLAALLALVGIWDADSFSFYLNMALEDLGIETQEPILDSEHPVPNRLVHFGISFFIFLNLMWGLINLLPVWPLDGGQITRDVCEGVSPGRGLVQSLGVSFVVAGILAAHCILVSYGHQLLPWRFGSLYTGILFAVLALQSFQLLQQVNARRSWGNDDWDDHDSR